MYQISADPDSMRRSSLRFARDAQALSTATPPRLSSLVAAASCTRRIREAIDNVATRVGGLRRAMEIESNEAESSIVQTLDDFRSAEDRVILAVQQLARALNETRQL